MIFKWLKGGRANKTITSIVGADDDAFVLSTATSIKSGAHEAGAMIAVAYMNLIQIIQVTVELASRNNDPKSPKDIDDFIMMFEETLANTNYGKDGDGEIKKRRIQWFFLAAMLMRATAISRGKVALESTMADTWIIIAEGCQFLENSLKHNILWTANEKSWFQLIQSKKAGIDYCLNHVMPQWLKSNSAIEDYAESQNINLF